MIDKEVSNILSQETIVSRAEKNWNEKSCVKRLASGNKYKHIFKKLHMPENDWSSDFASLTESQRSILIKGELIRTYDGLPNIKKTILKRHLGLSSFSTKWFKLPSCDKKILLTSITR
jgi:hypothetical protein